MPKREPKSPEEAFQLAAYGRLWYIRRHAHHHAGPFIEGDDFNQYQIKEGDKLNLDSGDAIEFGPRFCAPLSLPDLQDKLSKTKELEKEPRDESFPEACKEADASQIVAYFNDFIGHQLYERTLIARTPWEQACVESCNFKLHLEPRCWAMSSIYFIADRSSPHIACDLFDYSETAPGDDRLRRHELLCATGLIMLGLKMDKKREFKTIPAFVYSFSSRYARILQFHLDEEELVVRKTDWLYFPHQGDATKEMHLFLRWMVGNPIGSTRFRVF